MRFNNDLILQECEFYAQGKTYIVNPISFYYIRKKEFEKDGFFTLSDKTNELLFSSLISEQGRKLIDKWLKRLVTTIEGETFSLEKMANDEWDSSDLISLFETILEISGLSKKEEAEQSEKNSENKDDGYMSLYVGLLMNRTMTRQEILNSSIPYLIEVSKEIGEVRALTSGFGGLGGIGATSTEPVKQCSSMEEFVNAMNS